MLINEASVLQVIFLGCLVTNCNKVLVRVDHQRFFFYTTSFQLKTKRFLSIRIHLITFNKFKQGDAAMGTSHDQELILWFDDIGIDDVPLVGGKNASYGLAPWWLVSEVFVDLW